MKNYINYIKENDENISLEKVFSDCKPFIETLRKCDFCSFLIRGVNTTNFMVEDINYFKTRKNRTPSDTPLVIHNKLNDLFEDKFGWKSRNGIFCYGSNYYINTDYGDQDFLLFPIGDFEFVWNPNIVDLYKKYIIFNKKIYDDYQFSYGQGQKGYYEYDGKKYEDKYLDELIYKLSQKLNISEKDLDGKIKWIPEISFIKYHNKKYREFYSDIMKDYTNKNLCEAMKHKSEISIKCDDYYLIDTSNTDIYNEIKKHIWNKI